MDIKKIEIFSLRLSFAGIVIVTFFTAIAGIITHSDMMILNAMLALVDVAVTLAVIGTVKLLQRPRSKQYHFGYYKFEPLIVAVESALIIIVCIESILHAIKALVHHNHLFNYEIGLSVAIINILVGLMVYGWLRHAARRVYSEVLRVECVAWYISIIIDLIIFLGFAVVFAIHYYKIESLIAYSAYIDPSLTFIIVGCIIWEPIQLFTNSIGQLIDSKPNAIDEYALLQDIMAQAELLNIKINKSKLDIRQAGRALFIYFFYLPNQIENEQKIYEFSRLSARIVQQKYIDFIVHFQGIPTDFKNEDKP